MRRPVFTCTTIMLKWVCFLLNLLTFSERMKEKVTERCFNLAVVVLLPGQLSATDKEAILIRIHSTGRKQRHRIR